MQPASPQHLWFQSSDPDWEWRWWLPLPLYPYSQRRTLLTEIIPDWVWSFEQVQGVLYVITPLRMTVIRLEEGGLLIYAPLAPTPECLRLVHELEDCHGPVLHIISPTLSGLEHKVFVGPFARHFPQATIYIAPGQWSFPVNLPLSWLGLPTNRIQLLTADGALSPRFDFAILGPIDLNLGKFGEIALFDRRWKLLLITDTVISIPATAPEIVQLHPYPLLFHARDRANEPVTDTPENRRKGWQRTVLFTLYFRPGCLEIPSVGQVIKNIPTAPDKSRQAFFGLYPFNWQADWLTSFQALQKNGQLQVAPILQQLILNRDPEQTLTWVDQVAQWDFQSIIGGHFQSPIAATAVEWRSAFNFLTHGSSLPRADLHLLQKIDNVLNERGILPPAISSFQESKTSTK